MFGLFKKKNIPPTFASLVTDMHCHLLPQVDDGSRSLEESLEVLKTIKAVGFEEVRLTPHFQTPRFVNDEDDITRRFANFCNEVDRYRDEMDLPRLVAVSGEYRIDDGFKDYFDSGRMLTLPFDIDGRGSNTKGLLLTEFSLHQPRLGGKEAIFDCQMAGYDVILAHPERYPYYDRYSKKLEQLKEQGVYFQVNILSLEGFYGDLAKKNAYNFIENGWVEFLGTDAHNTVYAEALRSAAQDKKIIRLLEKETFMNSKLVECANKC